MGQLALPLLVTRPQGFVETSRRLNMIYLQAPSEAWGMEKVGQVLAGNTKAQASRTKAATTREPE